MALLIFNLLYSDNKDLFYSILRCSVRIHLGFSILQKDSSACRPQWCALLMYESISDLIKSLEIFPFLNWKRFNASVCADKVIISSRCCGNDCLQSIFQIMNMAEGLTLNQKETQWWTFKEEHQQRRTGQAIKRSTGSHSYLHFMA